jgi:hypothetical protein
VFIPNVFIPNMEEASKRDSAMIAPSREGLSWLIANEKWDEQVL